ncbi:hypothetical protein R1sor_009440 [Riccia sorocarpa]|uniref:Uncharacterized protein n=1 Tax=Riccia sorocarpa TaxID=122646 RepID=A0ABD3HX49_9MARC
MKQAEVTTEGRSERTPTKQPYRPPVTRTPQPSSASKRKQRSISDSEGGEEGRANKLARSRGPVHKIYGTTPSFTPTPLVRPAIQKGVIHQSEVKRPQNLRLKDWKNRARQIKSPRFNEDQSVNLQCTGVNEKSSTDPTQDSHTGNGSIMDMAIWAHIEGAQEGQLGIIAIYAPNSAAERTILWERIKNQLDSTIA